MSRTLTGAGVFLGVGMDPMLMAALAGGGDPTAAPPAAPLAGLAPGTPAPGMMPPGMAPPGMPPGMGMPPAMPFDAVSPEAMMMQAMQQQQQFAMQQAMAHQVVAEQLGLAANGASQGFMESPAVMPVEPGMQQGPLGGF